MFDGQNFYAIIHGFKLPEHDKEVSKPFLWISIDKDMFEGHLKALQDDINEGGGGKIHFAGEIDNIELTKFWVMPFNK